MNNFNAIIAQKKQIKIAILFSFFFNKEVKMAKIEVTAITYHHQLSELRAKKPFRIGKVKAKKSFEQEKVDQVILKMSKSDPRIFLPFTEVCCLKEIEKGFMLDTEKLELEEIKNA